MDTSHVRPEQRPSRLMRAARCVRRRASGERGFVLTFVVFALAALSVGATAAFLVVHGESRMAAGALEGGRAFQLAEAGMTRYIAEAVGTNPDSAVYEIGGGRVVVRAEKVLDVTDTREMYLITSVATVADLRTPKLPARRTVRQFASLERRTFSAPGAATLFADELNMSAARVDGVDAAAGRCGRNAESAVAGAAMLPGADLNKDNGASIDGSPAMRDDLGTDAMYDSAGVDWPALTDPAFPYDYDLGPGDAWPSIDEDEYPTIRVDGDFNASRWRSGRGLLVVTGKVSFSGAFEWDGAILAGDMAGAFGAFDDIHVEGALIAGLNAALDPPGNVNPSVSMERMDLSYNSCNVLDAAAGVALLEPVDNTWWESGF